MENKELIYWSAQAYAELRKLELRKHIIVPRCCMAAVNGAVIIEPYVDNVLMQEYVAKLVYCPECGAKLDFNLRDEPAEDEEHGEDRH